jgi:hypothetical protein
MRLLTVATLAVGLVGLTQASAINPDPSGTWKWMSDRGGKTQEQTLRLKLEGDKLTGVLIGRGGRETAIENAQYKDGEVSFNVTRMRGDQKFVTKYTAKVEGDRLKGMIEMDRDGQSQKREFEARRVND